MVGQDRVAPVSEQADQSHAGHVAVGPALGRDAPGWKPGSPFIASQITPGISPSHTIKTAGDGPHPGAAPPCGSTWCSRSAPTAPRQARGRHRRPTRPGHDARKPQGKASPSLLFLIFPAHLNPLFPPRRGVRLMINRFNASCLSSLAGQPSAESANHLRMRDYRLSQHQHETGELRPAHRATRDLCEGYRINAVILLG